MSEDQMRYDLMAQDALRSVIRLAMKRVQDTGLPGEHHFFIAVSTTHPGVEISDRLREKYPEEMTIVLQHQFWNLKVFDTFFKVELSFDNAPEKLVVPYMAVKGFFDPSVQFGLQFEVSDSDEETGEDTPLTPLEAELARAEETEEAEEAERQESEVPEETKPALASNDDSSKGDSTVVSLDAFRKK